MPRGRALAGGVVLPNFGGARGRPGEEQEGPASDSEGGSSSANEYAEGLGCADSKRCRERVKSMFDFDRAPREEYFAEPKPDWAATHSDDEEVAAHPPTGACRRALAATSGRPVSEVLAALERLEGDVPQDRADRTRLLAAQARRRERRLGRHAQPFPAEGRPGPGAGPGPGPGPGPVQRSPAVKSAGTCEAAIAGMLDLQTCCRLLSEARERMTGGLGTPQMLREEEQHVLEVLRLLSRYVVDGKSLKASGLGLEVNTRFWRSHADRRVAEAASALVCKWRAAVRLQGQARGQASEKEQRPPREPAHVGRHREAGA